MAYRKFISHALGGKPIDVFGDGSQTRSNTYIDDCVQGTLGALERGIDGQIYNIAGSTERSLNEALSYIEASVGKAVAITYLPRARGDQDRTFGDSTKAQKELGFAHTVSLEEGLERQVKWQRDANLF
jgi:nucleoside-diphosphate-sugar epimerase